MCLAALAATASNLVDIDAIAPACLPACLWQVASSQLQVAVSVPRRPVSGWGQAKPSRAGGYNLTPTTCGMPHGLKLANILQCFVSITYTHTQIDTQRERDRQADNLSGRPINR